MYIVRHKLRGIATARHIMKIQHRRPFSVEVEKEQEIKIDPALEKEEKIIESIDNR